MTPSGGLISHFSHSNCAVPPGLKRNVMNYAVLILAPQRISKMTKYHRDILIDQRTSCTKDEAAAILLGRRSWDPIYKDSNPEDDPEEVHDQFMAWLDISIFDALTEERDDILSALDDALGDDENTRDETQVTLCRERIDQCDNTIRRAKLILCDIDDEIAKGANSKLRQDSAQTQTSGRTHITLSSLKAWAVGQDYLSKPLDVSPAQPEPPARIGTEVDEPLLDKKGWMRPKSASSFLVTFAVLLEQFVAKAGPKYGSSGGTGINKQAIIDLLSEESSLVNRVGQYLDDQSRASIKARIGLVIDAAVNAVQLQRDKPQKVKKVVHKS